ncbi:DUF333 domain-containing protein [Providencia sp. PROV273]|nr:DUF333 domain-containing protein [Providencia sp. PROV273]
MVKDSKGNDVGICSFDNGNKFDEWTLYRMFN